MVTLRSKFRSKETLEVHREVPRNATSGAYHGVQGQTLAVTFLHMSTLAVTVLHMPTSLHSGATHGPSDLNQKSIFADFVKIWRSGAYHGVLGHEVGNAKRLGLRVVKPSLPVQGYLAHKKQPPPPGRPYDPTVGSSEGGVFLMSEVLLYGSGLRVVKPSFPVHSSQFKNNCFTEMCSGSEEGSYLRLIDFCVTQL